MALRFILALICALLFAGTTSSAAVTDDSIAVVRSLQIIETRDYEEIIFVAGKRPRARKPVFQKPARSAPRARRNIQQKARPLARPSPAFKRAAKTPSTRPLNVKALPKLPTKRVSVSRAASKQLTRNVKASTRTLARQPLTQKTKSKTLSTLRQNGRKTRQFTSSKLNVGNNIHNATLRGPRIYKDGTKTAMAHIMRQHGHSSTASGKGKFSKGMSTTKLKSLIRQAVKKGKTIQKSNGLTVIRHTFNKDVGTTNKGKATKTMLVYVRNGKIQTALPSKK